MTARLSMPANPGDVGIVLAHGAGAGQDHPWMVTMRTALAGHGFPTMTFNYAYIEMGRKAPDRPIKLLAVHAAALERMSRYVDVVVLAGKSMGGRMASHLVDETPDGAAGLVYYGYPLVPLGKQTPRPTDQLERIGMPQLFFVGGRDRLGPPAMIEELVARLPDAEVIVIDDADHSFHVPKRTGTSDDEVLARLARTTAEWIHHRITSPARP